MGSFIRSPLGVFLAILIVGFALIAVGMKALGGTSSSPYPAPKPLTLAQFKREGNQIGRSLCLQEKPIVNKKPHSLREFATGIQRLTALFDGLKIRLDGLVPPPSRARSFYRFRSKMDLGIHALDHSNHLAQTHQWRQFVLFVRSKWFRKVTQFAGRSKGKLRCGHASLATA